MHFMRIKALKTLSLLAVSCCCLSCGKNEQGSKAEFSRPPVDESAIQVGDFSLSFYAEKGGYVVCDYRGKEDTVILPSSAPYEGENWPVVEVAPYAFALRDHPKVLGAGDGLRKLPNNALAYSAVETFYVGSHLMTIEDGAFNESNAQLKKTTYKNVTYLESYTNSFCTAIEAHPLAEGGADLAAGTQCVWNDTLGNMNDRISGATYSLDSSIVCLGEGLSPYFYLYGTNELKMDYLGAYSFMSANQMGLKKLDLYDAFFIGGYVCDSLTTLEEIRFSRYFPSVPETACADCSGLSKLTIPEGVTSIGEWAFLRCKALTKLELPSTIKKIESGAFQECDKIASVYFAGTKAQWRAMGRASDWITLARTGEVYCSDGTLSFD